MSGKKARAARQAAHVVVPVAAHRSGWQRSWMSWKWMLIGLGVVAVVSATFVVPKLFRGESTVASHADMAMGAEPGAGLPAGSTVPSFSERDVETGKAITSRSLIGKRTLLFFSEGVMCQACFEQIKGLEQFGAELDERGIQLVSITPDTPGDLRQAMAQFDIRTPMIADEDRDMSRAFNTLGKGMHGDTPGHAFVLLEKGKVLWYRDYWLAPSQTMYVAPKRLLADLPALAP
jgi:peroxiredoxin Q/BCP